MEFSYVSDAQMTSLWHRRAVDPLTPAMARQSTTPNRQSTSSSMVSPCNRAHSQQWSKTSRGRSTPWTTTRSATLPMWLMLRGCCMIFLVSDS